MSQTEESESERSSEDPDLTPPSARTSRLRAAVVGIAAAIALVVGLSVAGVGDFIDLPAWANVSGVDVPLIGDTDVLVCRLEQVEGTTRVQISLEDGDEDTYSEFVHVWNNGVLLEGDDFEQIRPGLFVASSTDGTDEQFYALSPEPLPDTRHFCSSLILDRG